MTSTPRPVSKTFRILAIATFVIVLFATLPILLAIVVAWLPGELAKEMYDTDIATHRFHATALSAANWVMLAALGTQLRKPQQRFATAILPLIALALLTPVDLMSPFFMPVQLVVLALFIAMLWFHPARGDLHWRPVDRATTVLLAIGGVPWLMYAWEQWQAQLAGPIANRHVQLAHYGFMAVVTLIILATVAVGSTSLPGWRAATLLGAAGATVFGVAAVIAPAQVSSPGVLGGIAAIAWAAALVVATVVRPIEASPMPPSARSRWSPTPSRAP